MTYRPIRFLEYTRAAFVAQWIENDGRYSVRREGDAILWTNAPRVVLKAIPIGFVYSA